MAVALPVSADPLGDRELAPHRAVRLDLALVGEVIVGLVRELLGVRAVVRVAAVALVILGEPGWAVRCSGRCGRSGRSR